MSRLQSNSLLPALLLFALGVSFFGSLVAAAAFFPRGYIWYRTVISSLASPRDDPHGYPIACAGLAFSALLLVPFEAFLHKRLFAISPRWTRSAGKLFLLGALCLLFAALVVPGHYRVLGIGRTHEHLAQVSAVAFFLSLFCYLQPIFRLPRDFYWLRPAALLFVASPLTALLVSRLTLVCAYEFASAALYHVVKASLWSSLALWEWVGAVCVYFFLGMVTLGLSETTPLGADKV